MKNTFILLLFFSLAGCQQPAVTPQTTQGEDANEALVKSLSDGPTISLQKGNLVSIHTITVELKPNVTMDQVLDFYNTKWAPAEAQYFGWKSTYFGKCLRGTECAENKILMITIFDTAADRDKYFNMATGGNDLNELGEKAWAQFAPTYDALLQLATIEEEWADWAIK